MRILFTNTSLAHPTGSELFIRDIALQLHQRGHIPIIYSLQLGPVAEGLRNTGISVVDDLLQIKDPPDVIHGQHCLEAMTALARFPAVPALFFCHGVLPWQETPFNHPRIIFYVAMSELIREHMIKEHYIPNERIILFANFVDLETFIPRPSSLPIRPKRALIFSNNACDTNFVKPIRAACSEHALKLDVIGIASGKPTFIPEKILQKYEIVFARGRCALEALAVGAAVICCDIEGLGSMVTTDNWFWFRRYNFGLHTLNRAITIETISKEILKYDPVDAAKASEITREEVGLITAVEKLLEIYEDCFSNWTPAFQESIKTNFEAEAFSTILKNLTEQIYSLYQQNSSLSSQLNSLYKQNSSFSSQIDNLFQENSFLSSELRDIKKTLTWRLRDQFFAFTPFKKIYLSAKPALKFLRSKKISTARYERSSNDS